MNVTLNKFRKRNIQANFSYFVLVIFVVAVSICLIVGLFISHFTFKKAVVDFCEQSNLPNLWVNVDEISEVDEVFFDKNYEYSKRCVFDSDFYIDNKGYSAKFIISDGKFSVPYIVDGDKQEGCYVDAKFAQKYDVGVGHSYVKLNLEFGGRNIEVSFLVVGTISMAENLAVDDEYEIFIDEDVFVKTATAYFKENISLEMVKYNQILVSSNVSNEDILKIKNYFETSQTNLLDVVQKSELYAIKEINKELKISQIMLYTFPIIFIIVSILVVSTTISQMTIRERYNIGILRTLGVSNGQILKNYSGYGAFIGFLGSIIGLVGAPLIIPNLTFEVYDRIFNIPKDEVSLQVPILLIIFVVILSVIIGYFSAFFTILGISELSPKDCMTGKQKIKLKSRKIKNNLGLVGQVLKNIKIHLFQSIMSIVAVAGCGVLFILGFSASDAYNQTGYQNLSTINTFLNIFKGFSIVLLILILLIQLIQILRNRKKEMTILRIYGESYIKIWLSLFLEMLIVSVIGFVICAIFSYPILLVCPKIMGVTELFSLSFMSFFRAFLIVVLASTIISSFGLIKIYKLDLSSEIKFSE